MTDATLCASFTVQGKAPRSVIVVEVQRAYYQCQKALMRSRLWDPEAHVRRDSLPSAGQMAQHFSASHGKEFDGEAYDAGYDDYLKETMY